MFHSILGEENYHKGIDLYFERHDGDAATIENFVSAMEDASGYDLEQFTRWYHQAGTPTVNADLKFSNGKLTLGLEQTLPKTPGQDKCSAHPTADIVFDAETGEAIPFSYKEIRLSTSFSLERCQKNSSLMALLKNQFHL